MLRSSFFTKHMAAHTCRVKAAKLFSEVATNTKLASDKDLPKLAPTTDTVNDPTSKGTRARRQNQ